MFGNHHILNPFNHQKPATPKKRDSFFLQELPDLSKLPAFASFVEAGLSDLGFKVQGLGFRVSGCQESFQTTDNPA